MHTRWFVFTAVAFLQVAVVQAQSIVAPRDLDLTFGKASWGTFLPGYELGTDSTGELAVQDDLDSPGVLWELKGVKRFLHTRTSMELRGFYGLSWSNQTGNAASVNLPNPVDGSNVALSGGSSHLSSDLDHYGVEFTLRDTWQTRFGGLSAGMVFSYMAFDQDFDVRYNRIMLFNEALNQDFVGGKGFVGWEGFIHGRATTFDLFFGYYDLDAEYQFSGGSIGGSLATELSEQSGTIEAKWTTWTQLGGCTTGWTLGALYLTDFAAIEHTPGSPASLTTDSAGTLTAGVEWLW